MNHGRQCWHSARFAGHRCCGPGSGRSWSRGDGGLWRRWRIRTYRCEEGATPLLATAEETGKTRGVFVLQSMQHLQLAGLVKMPGLGISFLKTYFLCLLAIVSKMQAQQRKPLLHFFFFPFYMREPVIENTIWNRSDPEREFHRSTSKQGSSSCRLVANI